MAVKAYFQAPSLVWTTGSVVTPEATGFFVVDTFAELPSNVNEGDRAYAKDVDVFYKRTGSAWVPASALEARTSDPSSPVTGEMWFRSDL